MKHLKPLNRKAEAIHWEGDTTLAYVLYNPMGLRADGFMMGINGTSKGNKFSPMRSASAVVASVRDGNRDEIIHQQNTISASGHSGFAVTPERADDVATPRVRGDMDRCTPPGVTGVQCLLVSPCNRLGITSPGGGM